MTQFTKTEVIEQFIYLFLCEGLDVELTDEFKERIIKRFQDKDTKFFADAFAKKGYKLTEKTTFSIEPLNEDHEIDLYRNKMMVMSAKRKGRISHNREFNQIIEHFTYTA